jgi:hypothetical protein
VARPWRTWKLSSWCGWTCRGGHAAIDQICPDLIAIERDCLAELSPAEQRQLITLLTKIQDRITQRHAAPESAVAHH